MKKGQLLYYSCKEIGIPRLAEYARYVLQKKTGQLIRKTPLYGFTPDFDIKQIEIAFRVKIQQDILRRILKQNSKKILETAEELLSGNYHPFGGESQPLSLELPEFPLVHWSKTGDQVDGLDIKWLWEPARFTWAFDLVRAWMVNTDDRFVRFFWERFHEFRRCNPVNSSPNWTSAQEVGLRLLTWLMVYQVFRDSPATTAEDKQSLAEAVWQHAARIPATLGYARSQNNNHLLCEALALIAAGHLFSEKSGRARNWLKLGFAQFNQGILDQVEEDGTYSQHSANYHRMMLQLALIYNAYTQFLGLEIPAKVKERLAAATRWTGAQLDPISGRLPNRGHNDGSLPLPMGCSDFRDQRPTLQAASLAFLGDACLPAGAWDELSAWLGLDVQKKISFPITSPAVHQLIKENTRVSLRGVRFHGRPAHADQLHVDLWWDGINVLQDAGTYCYNCDPPWQNPFSSTLTHNTITVNEQEQMLKAGKFLWLRQAQAQWLPVDQNCLSARHDGYRKIGVIHHRTVCLQNPESLRVVDHLLIQKQNDAKQVRLHWLLPDWQRELNGQKLTLTQKQRKVEIGITATQLESESGFAAEEVSLIRAGETLAGPRNNEVLGWASDTYGEKHPALSFSCLFTAMQTIQIVTEIKLLNSASRMRK